MFVAVVATVSTVALCLEGDKDWGAVAAHRQLAESKSKDEALAAQMQDILQRIQIKRDIVQDVIHGRMPLRQAAAEFTELNSVCPAHLRVFRHQHPGMSDEEIMCRNVMSFVAMELQGRPEEAASVQARLERELVAK